VEVEVQMGYTDKELRDATQIAYMDFTDGYAELNRRNKEPPYTIRQIKDATKDPEKCAAIDKIVKENGISIDLDTLKIAQIHNTNNENGFYGCIIETSDKEAIVAFRGSEEPNGKQLRFDWINADLALINNKRTTQQAEVDKFLEDIKTNGYLDKYTSVASTGHSLGGNLSDYFTIRSVDYGISDKIKQSVSFDGPNFSKEFLEDNKKQIDSVSNVMKHYQWSAVGNLLFPVPGVEFDTAQIKDYGDTSTYLQNQYKDEFSYNLICRHDTRSLEFDKHGNLINGKTDNFAWFMGKVSKGIDRLPSGIGNFMKDNLTYYLLLGDETKSLFVDAKGLTGSGTVLVAGGAIAVLANPIGTLAITANVIAVTVALIAASFGIECLIEFFESAIEKVSELVSKAIMAMKEVAEFKDLLKKEAAKIIDLAKRAISLLPNSANEFRTEVTSKIRDYSIGMLEELKNAYSLIISEDFFDMGIWNKKFAYEKWFNRLYISPIQSAASHLTNSVQEAGIGFINNVTGVFKEVQELDNSFAKYLNTKVEELNAISGLLD
jgi:hypothetical protein